MKRAASLVPDLYAVDADYALSELCKDEQKLEKVLLSREFHISLGRPVAVQVHQIDSFIAMLRQKFQPQQRLVMSMNFAAVTSSLSFSVDTFSCNDYSFPVIFFLCLCVSLSLMEILHTCGTKVLDGVQ